MKKNNVLIISNAFSASIAIPFTNLNEISEKNLMNYVHEETVTLTMLQSADVCIFLRVFSDISINLMTSALNLGKPVIYAMDDDFLNVHEVSYFDYLKPGTHLYRNLETHLRSATKILCFSDYLVKDLKSYNSVQVLKTNIQSKYLDRTVNLCSSPQEPIRIIYAGTFKKEIERLWGEFVYFSSQYKERVEIHFWTTHEYFQLPPLQCDHFYQPFDLNYNEYLNKLVFGGFHIMLAPLFTDIKMKFSKCPIKYLEATAAGCIGLYTDMVVYNDVAAHQSGIMVPNTLGGAEWFNALANTISLSNDAKQEMWGRAKEHILSEYTTERVAQEFDAFIEGVLN